MTQAALDFDHPISAGHEGGGVSSLVALVEAEMALVETRLARELESPVGRIPEVGGHLLAAGGKRLRPLLAVLAARASQTDLAGRWPRVARPSSFTPPPFSTTTWWTAAVCAVVAPPRA